MYCVSVYVVCDDASICFFSFFFFKQKTAYEMRISDWSSDVCSSDLANEVWNIAGGLTAPIFHGGELRARKRAAVARYDQAFANYRQVVLQAFANVADSLHALDNDAQALQSRYAALQSADQNLDLVQQSYKRSEEHTSELQSLMRISYAVFCLKNKKNNQIL